MSFVVAIDGPAGTGKGTVTKLVSEELGLINIDTGAMYRCVTLEIINRKVNLEDIVGINNVLNTISIDMKNIYGNLKFYLNNLDVTTEIRTQKVIIVKKKKNQKILLKRRVIQKNLKKIIKKK